MSSGNGRLTISDIAAAAGVSRTTVSRYINGRTDLMSDSTRERLKAVIEVSHYRPSEIARSLKTKKTNLVGVLVADITSPFSSAVLETIGDSLTRGGFMPLFADCGKDLQKEQRMIELFLSKDVAGLIVNTTSYENNALIGVACREVPIVLCDRYVRNYSFNIVTFEAKPIFRTLIAHLKEQGYTRPVLFSQPWENNSSRFRRRNAFIAAVQELYGYDPSGDVYRIDSRDEASALHQMEAMLATLQPGEIPAVIGVNTVTTLRMYKAVRQVGLKIPEEIGVCGPEDWNWQPEMGWPLLVEPSITTFSLPAKEMGRQSAELLMELIENRPVESRDIKLPCELLIRESTSRL